jgi:small nuclear ribonucleoprotein (snRNP)-like protein
MKIELSKYVGKHITVTLGDDKILTGVLRVHGSRKYPYMINGYWYSNEGIGHIQPNIVRILSEEQTFNGIAQKAPNINLGDFVGQKVYMKLANGYEFIRHISNSYYLGGVGTYDKDGRIIGSSPTWNIVEIYGEGAYEIKTKPTFDEPNDAQIEEAKQMLSQMSEEQIAKLLKSLK